MGIPVYLDQVDDNSFATNDNNTNTNTSPPTLPPRHPHRRLTHYYQNLRLNQHPHHSSSSSSQLEHLVGFSFRSDQAPVRPPRQSSLARVDTITPRRGSERSSILFRYYQQQQQAHHLRQSQQDEEDNEEEGYGEARRSEGQTPFLSPPTSAQRQPPQPPSVPSRSRSRPLMITVAEPVISSSPPLSPSSRNPSVQPWDHGHQLSLYERSQQRRQPREQLEQYEAQLEAHQRRATTQSQTQTQTHTQTHTPRPTVAFSLESQTLINTTVTDSTATNTNTTVPSHITQLQHERRHNHGVFRAFTNRRRTRASHTAMEEKEQVSVLQVETGSTPQVTSASGTTSLTIDTSASSLATNRSHRTSSPTVQQNSVLPSVSPPSTSTTVATATGRSSTTVQEAPLSIIIVHFEGYGGSPRTHTASTTVRGGGGGGGQYRDAMQHHEQFRRAVQELAIPVREVCSLMPVLNAMCCIVEDPSGLWKLAQVPVVKHLWKGGVAGIPPRESSSAMAMAMIQSALASSFSSSSPSTPLPPQPQQHQHPQYQGHVKDDRDRERVDISSDDVCAGQQPAFSFSPPSSSSSSSSSSLPTCTASIPVFSRSLPRTLPVAQGQDEDDKDRGRAWMEAPTSVNTPDIDKVAKEGGQGGTSHLLVSSDWQDGEQ